jgi:ferredoxin, 2Fe-2S
MKVIFISSEGVRQTVEVQPGGTLMEAALLNMVPGVEGMCGGVCSCATCHCYVQAPWGLKIDAPRAGELEMLDAVTHRRADSRLGCQVPLTTDLDGIEVLLPPSQG